MMSKNLDITHDKRNLKVFISEECLHDYAPGVCIVIAKDIKEACEIVQKEEYPYDQLEKDEIKMTLKEFEGNYFTMRGSS